MRKLFLILTIGLVGFMIYARHHHIVPFDKIPVKIAREEAVINDLLEEDFYSFEINFDHAIRLGGGKSIMVYDTSSGRVISYNQFIDQKTKFAPLLDQIELVRKNHADSVNISPVDFSIQAPYTKMLETSVPRNFYLGIYREFVENLQNWNRKYKSIIVLSKTIKTADANSSLLVMLHTYTKDKKAGKDAKRKAEIAFLIPALASTNHLWDYAITKDFSGSHEVKSFLDHYSYSYPDYRTIKKNWKVDPKLFELRNLKWNFE